MCGNVQDVKLSSQPGKRRYNEMKWRVKVPQSSWCRFRLVGLLREDAVLSKLKLY